MTCRITGAPTRLSEHGFLLLFRRTARLAHKALRRVAAEVGRWAIKASVDEERAHQKSGYDGCESRHIVRVYRDEGRGKSRSSVVDGAGAHESDVLFIFESRWHPSHEARGCRTQDTTDVDRNMIVMRHSLGSLFEVDCGASPNDTCLIFYNRHLMIAPGMSTSRDTKGQTTDDSS